MTDLSILNEQNLRILLGELSDWCFHMRKHLGINASNYFMYRRAAPWVGWGYRQPQQLGVGAI